MQKDEILMVAFGHEQFPLLCDGNDTGMGSCNTNNDAEM